MLVSVFETNYFLGVVMKRLFIIIACAMVVIPATCMAIIGETPRMIKIGKGSDRQTGGSVYQGAVSTTGNSGSDHDTRRRSARKESNFCFVCSYDKKK